MRPIGDAADETVLHRVDVAIIEMAREIAVVSDRVFPEAPLPQGSLAGAAAPRDIHAGSHERRREFRLDPAPALREIHVALG